MKQIDIDTWHRKDLYNFFKTFDCPLYGKTIQVDVTDSYNFCKENNLSFFIICLYVFLKASNEVPEFRYREIDEKLFDMEVIDAATYITIDGDEHHQFATAKIPYSKTFNEFLKSANEIIGNIKNGNIPNEKDQQESNLISLSCIPWFSYTGGTFGKLSSHQSMPILDWGKVENIDGKKILCYSFQINHTFIDGYHMGQFVNKIADFFTNPEKL